MRKKFSESERFSVQGCQIQQKFKRSNFCLVLFQKNGVAIACLLDDMRMETGLELT